MLRPPTPVNQPTASSPTRAVLRAGAQVTTAGQTLERQVAILGAGIADGRDVTTRSPQLASTSTSTSSSPPPRPTLSSSPPVPIYPPTRPAPRPPPPAQHPPHHLRATARRILSRALDTRRSRPGSLPPQHPPLLAARRHRPGLLVAEDPPARSPPTAHKLAGDPYIGVLGNDPLTRRSSPPPRP